MCRTVPLAEKRPSKVARNAAMMWQENKRLGKPWTASRYTRSRRHLNLWLHTLIELWAWARPKEELCDRSMSPWDDPERRPSHADRRNALRRSCIEQEFSDAQAHQRLSRKLQRVVTGLLRMVG
jgi:hypothetical protein